MSKKQITPAAMVGHIVRDIETACVCGAVLKLPDFDCTDDRNEDDSMQTFLGALHEKDWDIVDDRVFCDACVRAMGPEQVEKGCLKPFGQPCVKCAEAESKSVYRSVKAAPVYGVEHLHRTCSRCGFIWDEHTKDHDNE